MHWRADPPPVETLSAEIDAPIGRRLSAAAYWARLRPNLAAFGITRVADITGLDRLGFPVVQAVRPSARSNAVTQGKAATPEGAAVGAVLECLEMAAGEDPETLAAGTRCDRIDWQALAPTGRWPDADTPFAAAWDIGRDAPASVPRALLSTDFSRGAVAESAPILRHSIGLGAGARMSEAMLHGVLECIEADARIRTGAGGGARRLALDTADTTYGWLLARVQAAGLRVAIHDISCRDGACAVAASVMEAPGATTLPLPASGYACRLSFPEAIAAALAEAIQARLAAISGAREDITQRFYHHGATPALLEREWARHGPTPGLSVPVVQAKATPLRTLTKGLGPVLAVPLHWAPQTPLAICRIVVPGLLADPLRMEAA